MHHFSPASEQILVPSVTDPEHAALGFERWQDALAACGDEGIAEKAAVLMAAPEINGLMASAFSFSPYLTQSIVSNPVFTCALFDNGPEWAMKDIHARIEASRIEVPITAEGTSQLAKVLRVAKREAALTIALADISGHWELEQITQALSDLADAAISTAAAHLLSQMAARGGLTLQDPEKPETGSGLVILGMGKLGSRELNYSSDIDLIILYDPERLQTEDMEGLQHHFVRFARSLVKLLDERTVDGYVFRTDLRLRPDPGATPLAISVLAAESYYESIGQNWERAAMIKARPVGGDLEAGAAFLKWLTPFVWRKNLDFAAIQDIHSIKRQINAHRGETKIRVEGHNVKLGHGGIREIEFFAQTQQLIWGGKVPELRESSTRFSLAALTDFNQISETVRDEMITAYRFLRRVEHRIQMIDDKQTHMVPETPEGVKALALFLGYPDKESFANALTHQLKTVEAHYAALFEDSPPLSVDGMEAGNLVFTGGDSDPETLATIERQGFKRPDIVDQTVRGWHHGRYRAMRSARARELLTELFPVLLKSIANTPDPDATFLKFDEFLSGLPSGVQLFSMFYSNPGLLDLVAEIMGGAPRLAGHLSRRPQVLESVLTQGFFDMPPTKAEMAEELGKILERCGNIEDVLVATRRWANDRKFQVGVLSLLATIGPDQTSASLSDIADTSISALYAETEKEMASLHGRLPDSAMAILAMGKLGSREMTAESDLDLVFIYDLPKDAGASDGAKPLTPGQYFARLGQRLINAITAQTAEGDLYEVDMRLRPSGTAGPIASSLNAFIQYNEASAWTWEHMALTRARIIHAPERLAHDITAAIHTTLTRPRDANALLADVADMRERMLKTHKTDFPWDVKHIRGGLVDVEFIAQYLQLRHAHSHPEVLSGNVEITLAKLSDCNLLDPQVAEDLQKAHKLWKSLQGLLRLTIPRETRKRRQHDIPESLQEKLVSLVGVESFSQLLEKMAKTADTVLQHFNDLIANPAANLPARD